MNRKEGRQEGKEAHMCRIQERMDAGPPRKRKETKINACRKRCSDKNRRKEIKVSESDSEQWPGCARVPRTCECAKTCFPFHLSPSLSIDFLMISELALFRAASLGWEIMGFTCVCDK